MYTMRATNSIVIIVHVFLHFSKAKLDIKELIMRYIHIKGSIIMGSVFSRKGVTQKSKVYKRDRVPLECEYINSRFSITCICSVLAFLYVFVTQKINFQGQNEQRNDNTS